MGEKEEGEHIAMMVDGITCATGGIPPSGYYVGRHSLKTLKLLVVAHKERGLALPYSSDSCADDLPYWVPAPGGIDREGMLVLPYGQS
jgi:hypothetical protein